MKRYIVWGHNAGFSYRLTHTNSKWWAYLVAYWYYFEYRDVEVYDKVKFEGVILL